jgi:hypothetical protein
VESTSEGPVEDSPMATRPLPKWVCADPDAKPLIPPVFGGFGD